MFSKLVIPNKFAGRYCSISAVAQEAKAPRSRSTHILRQPARPLGEKKDTILIQKEQDDQSQPGFRIVEQKGEWTGHNVYLKQLLLNKCYAHGFDYWKTIRKFGPTPNTLTYNIYFALVEQAGSPYDIIDTFYDFDETNILRVRANPDSTTYAYLIKAYCTVNDIESVKAALKTMETLGLEPTQRSYAIILDFCSDQNLLEYGAEISEIVKKKFFSDNNEQSEGLSENSKKAVQIDIELRNALLYFLGTNKLEEGEKFFYSFIRDDVKPSYNTYQRLIELYIKHNKPEDVARIIHLMKNDGIEPDPELTKYTLFQSFVESGSPSVLKSITNTYPKPTFQRDPHYKFFYDFISKYIAGGGPVYIPDGFLEIATEYDLEQLYVQVVSHEIGESPLQFELDSFGQTTVDLNELLEADDPDGGMETRDVDSRVDELLNDPARKNLLKLEVEEGELEKYRDMAYGDDSKKKLADESEDYSYDYVEGDDEDADVTKKVDTVDDDDDDSSEGEKKDEGEEGEGFEGGMGLGELGGGVESRGTRDVSRRRKAKLPKMPKLDEADIEVEEDESIHFEEPSARYQQIIEKINLSREEFEKKVNKDFAELSQMGEEEDDEEEFVPQAKEWQAIVEKQKQDEAEQAKGESVNEKDGVYDFDVITGKVEETNIKTENDEDDKEFDDIDYRLLAATYSSTIPKDLTQTEKEEREFNERLRLDKDDPIEKEIDEDQPEYFLKNPDKIEKLSRAPRRVPTQSELEKANLRKLYLLKIKKKYQDAKARNAPKEEIQQIRKVFETVKRTKIAQEEVDKYESSLDLQIHKLQYESPKAYKELYAMYRMEVHNDNSGFDDPELVANNDNPLEVMEAQFTAIDEFFEETHTFPDDNIFVDATRQFDHRNPDDPEMKRLLLRWGTNVQEMNNQDLEADYLRTRMASINVLMPNAPQKKYTGHPDDVLHDIPDEFDDYNFL